MKKKGRISGYILRGAAAMLLFSCVIVALSSAINPPKRRPKVTAPAASATWSLNPSSGDWNTATNWTPPTVPNGPSDTATFGVSNTTDVSLSSGAEVSSIVFNAGASPFTITASPAGPLVVSGGGVTNNSPTTQNFIALPHYSVGEISFYNNATAGSSTAFTTIGAIVKLETGSPDSVDV